MKDVEACDKLRGASNHAMIRRFPNGEIRPFLTAFETELIVNSR